MIYDYGGRQGGRRVFRRAQRGCHRLREPRSRSQHLVRRGAARDNDWIHIGAGTNVQDGSIIHVDPGVPVRWPQVTIGHGVMLHGCEIGDGCLIGNRAMVLDGARSARPSRSGRCLITPNTVVPPGSVVMGSPGRWCVRSGRRPRMDERGDEAYRTSRAICRNLVQNQARPRKTTTAVTRDGSVRGSAIALHSDLHATGPAQVVGPGRPLKPGPTRHAAAVPSVAEHRRCMPCALPLTGSSWMPSAGQNMRAR